ncbi:class I SAM-dependent methyltransferase [Rhodoplanes azumiensis]|uniref:Class I SAM-dependent methyltransferase n=1 Tax=Rhodoplanes azumiensis TaxID=1897628 RepID=A0ABW5AJW7_9BRAD
MTADVQSDARLLEHRRVWERKDVLRIVYSDYYRRMLELAPVGPLLDIGGGSAHVKNFRPDAVSLDILPFPGIDTVADAHQLPFPDGHFASIIMLDVLHHLDRPIVFLKEAARVLRKGGRLLMIEPGITPVSWWFYHFVHQEPVIMGQDPFAMTEKMSGKDPFDSNQAIPTLVFGRANGLKRLAAAVPEFEVKAVDWLSLLVYPLSGGFKSWCLVPEAAASPGIAFENRLPAVLRRTFGFRIFVALERR